MKHRLTKALAALMAATLCLTAPAGSLLPTGTYAAAETAYAAATYTDSQRTATNVSKVTAYSAQLRSANSSGRTTGQFTWDTENKTRSWTYYNGLMMDAFAMEGASNYSYVDAFYNANISTSGGISNLTTGQLDSVEPIRGAFDMFMNSGYTSGNAAKYQLGIKTIYTMLENQTSYSNAGGNYAHKQDSSGNTSTTSWAAYPIALDGIYMAQPFLMECANAIQAGKLTLTNKNNQTVTADSLYTAVYNRMVWIYNNLYNANTHLYDHAATPSGSTNGLSWSRSIGWYAMALVDIIEMMPNDSRKTNLIAELPRIFDGLIEYQDAETGMWYNVTAYNGSLSGTYQNKLETSGTSQFAYAMMKAYNNGYVTDSKYAEAGLRAFNGVIENKMTGSTGSYHVTDTYRSSGASTTATDYLKNPYVTDEAKGVGALIMAATLANETCEKLEAAAAPTLTGITVVAPYKTEYLIGESLDLTGLEVRAEYDDGISVDVTDYTVSALPQTAGQHTIIVTYMNFTENFVVEVHEESGTWVVKKSPGCTYEGQRVMYCTACYHVMQSETIPATGHTSVTVPQVDATCTANGMTAYEKCSTCGTLLVSGVCIPATGHTEVTDEAVERTCTRDGKTEGSHCSTCGKVFTAQVVTKAAGHKSVTDKGYAATCTTEGLKSGSHCSVCGEVLTPQEVIPAKGHTLVIEEGIPATCTEYGLTDEITCSVCKATIQELDLIYPLGHEIVVTPSTPATCTEPGLTAGTSCSRCGSVVQKQYEISPIGHVAKKTDGYPATCEKDGLTDCTVCSLCGIELAVGETIPALGHTPVIDEAVEATTCTGTGRTEGSHCSTCGKILEQQMVVPAVGHTRVIIPSVPATCTETGLTAGVVCGVCGEVLQQQYTIDAINHVRQIDPETPATCTQDGHTEGSVCTLCGEVFAVAEVLPAFGHTEVVDEAIPATCTSIGYTEGSHCEVCGAVINRQMVIAKTEHRVVVKPGKAAGWFTAGYTASTYCGDCGYVITEPQTINPIFRFWR